MGKGPADDGVEQALAGAAQAIRETPEGALIVGVLGGALGFFLAGPRGAIKLGLAGAKLGGELFAGGAPRATTTMPALNPAPKATAAARPPAPESPVLWVRSQATQDPKARDARPWILEGDGVRMGLLPGFTYSVGRDEQADIRIYESGHKGDTVSRRHASLGVIGDGLYLIDGDSRNGTWVDSTRVWPGRAMILRERTEVMLGKFTLVVQPAPRDVEPPESS